MNGTDTGSRYSYRGSRRAAPPGSGEKSAKSRVDRSKMRRPDGKFECGNDGGSPEVTNMLDRRKLEVLCVQETKWKGNRARTLAGKMLQAGGDGKSNGVGIIVSEDVDQ